MIRLNATEYIQPKKWMININFGLKIEMTKKEKLSLEILLRVHSLPINPLSYSLSKCLLSPPILIEVLPTTFMQLI